MAEVTKEDVVKTFEKSVIKRHKLQTELAKLEAKQLATLEDNPKIEELEKSLEAETANYQKFRQAVLG